MQLTVASPQRLAVIREPLAIEGGPQVQSSALAPWPAFDEEMCAAAQQVLKSGRVNYWTGEETRAFEREYASAVGVPHAIAVANGTVALELALFALGVGPGDEVIVPSRTFIASASCAVIRGAKPVIADLDPDSQNLTAESIRRVLTPRTRAIICVHFAGWPCDMDPILELARERNLYVIEDCAQAHGALYRGRPVGSMGHINAFSFCQDKILTTAGEGGLVTTSDPVLWERAWSFKDHGKSWDAVYHRQHPGSFKFLHESFGTNWRLTEIQSAIGRVMLRRLPSWVAQRRQRAQRLLGQLEGHPALRTPRPTAESFHSYYKCYAFLRPERLKAGWTRDRVVQALQAEGIPAGCGSCGEIYREVAFARAGFGPTEPLPVAHELHENSLMFLVHPTLTPEMIDATATAVEKVLAVASDVVDPATINVARAA